MSTVNIKQNQKDNSEKNTLVANFTLSPVL